MKKITLLAAILVAGTTLFAQTKWTVDKAHAKVGFTVRHMMLSDVDGNFKKFDASIIASKEDFSDAVFEISIDAASINTDNDMRDNDLKSDSYFDVAKYPQITFKSTSVNKAGDKNYKVTGNLTMHGVTKPVTFDLTLNGVGKSIMTHKPVAGFKVTGKISRTDFGVGTAPKAMVGDEITLKANGEFGQE
jgi:polyisoprenoid-binding protein YceI